MHLTEVLALGVGIIGIYLLNRVVQSYQEKRRQKECLSAWERYKNKVEE